MEFVADMSSEMEVPNFPVELCQTHTLPPALTLEAAANQIKEAICKLKSSPPPAASGVLRFQSMHATFYEYGISQADIEVVLTGISPPYHSSRRIDLVVNYAKSIFSVVSYMIIKDWYTFGIVSLQVAVPASIKALNWLSCQHNSLEVFPQLYLSGDQLEKTIDGSVSLERMHGVSGIGSAVHFMGASVDLKAYDLIRRYLSVDSPLIKAYGFVGIKSNSEFAMMHENGSFYVFIPQVNFLNFG
ncbi:hypothetical protein ACLOJK_035246 [Asimina triloba]